MAVVVYLYRYLEIHFPCSTFCFVDFIVLKGLAYPVNGIIMGGLDWKFTMIAMWSANFVCVGMVNMFVRREAITLAKIWWALAAFMGTQVITGILRFQSKTGVWKVLKGDKKQ